MAFQRNKYRTVSGLNNSRTCNGMFLKFGPRLVSLMPSSRQNLDFLKLGIRTLRGWIVEHCPEFITRQPRVFELRFFSQMFLVMILTTVQHFNFFQKTWLRRGDLLPDTQIKRRGFITARLMATTHKKEHPHCATSRD